MPPIDSRAISSLRSVSSVRDLLERAASPDAPPGGTKTRVAGQRGGTRRAGAGSAVSGGDAVRAEYRGPVALSGGGNGPQTPGTRHARAGAGAGAAGVLSPTYRRSPKTAALG